MLLTYKEKSLVVVRSRGLEPPRVAPLAPQASASTNSATTANVTRAAGPRAEATALDVTNQPGANKGRGANSSGSSADGRAR